MVLTGAPEGFPQTTTEFIGEVDAGDIIGFNIGVGLALNERAAISLGYDQSIVGETKQNGKDVPGSVRIVLGTLVLGGSYRFNDHTSLNVALGVGVTDDTPDVSLNVRVPITSCRPAVAVAATTAGRRCLLLSPLRVALKD